jgi:ABC-type arginine transport system ATPase subunit
VDFKGFINVVCKDFLFSFELKDQTNIPNLRKTVRMRFELYSVLWPIINIALLILIMYVVVKLSGKGTA